MALLSLNSAQFVSGNEVTIPPPIITDNEGNSIELITVGKQVTISKSFRTTIDSSRPFLALFDVRDSDGVSVYIAWQTGMVIPRNDVVVGISWMPEEAGDYEIRTFLISDWTNPEVLSPVASTNLKVMER